MIKAKIGCVQHDCAECKTMRRVYDAAMKCYEELMNTKFSGHKYIKASEQLIKACYIAKKGKKNGKG